MNAKHSDPRRGMPRRNPRGRKDDSGENTGAGDQASADNEDEGLIDLRLLVHQSVAGSVIGRGGERIKELRQVSPV